MHLLSQEPHSAGPGADPRASAGFRDHFSQVAAHYAQFRPVYPPALFAHWAQLCPSRAQAWDCACGNGQASVPLADHFDAVIATDGSAAQIAAARPHPRVRYRVAPAECCGLPDASMDLVTVAQALHWLDLPRFYGEVRRVLRPGGVLAVASYGRLQMEPAVDAQVQQFYRDVVGPYWPPGREHVDEGYRQLAFPFPELAPPQPALAIEVRWTLAHFAGYVRSWSATAAYVQARGEDPVAGLVEALAPLWNTGEAPTARLIRWPLAVRCGRAP